MPITKAEGKKDGLQKYRVRVNYTDGSGKYRQMERTAYGKDNAKALEQKLLYDLSNGEATPAHKMTVQDLFDEYIEVKATELREVTLKERKKRIEAYVLPNLKDVKLTDLTLPRLQKWKVEVEKLTKSDGSPFTLSTKQSLYSTFRALLNYAVKLEYMSRNPLVSLGNFKDPYAGKQEMDYYTPEEFKKYIAAAKREAEKSLTIIYEWHYYVFFNLAFYTGARKGEINALKWSDIDGNTLRIRRSINQQLIGDDRETPPKNKSSIRDIQIPAPLLSILNDHKARCQAVSGFTDGWRICGGEKPLRDTTLQKRNELYAKLAGVKYIRIHDFRHSHASVLANAGINIQEIARRLGHSNVEITWNTYSHLYPKEEERALAILNKI